MIKVRAHTCYLGNTGYAAHSRFFFRELSKYVDLRIRNYTWDSNPYYLNDTDLKILDQITLRDNDGKESTYPIKYSFPTLNWEKSGVEFSQDVDIVLMEQGHLYFYDTYNSNLKIAYTVWESTLLGDGFFRKLLEFDYLWVVSQWHKDCVVKQGYPENRVFVVNEGVNSEFFKDKEKLSHLEELHDDSFNFLFFGRWDYRKFVPEIISSFLEAFPNGEKVNLILSADNPYPVDGLNSTEERLKHYGFNDPRIKVKHFLKRDEYVSYVKNSNVMITCARSEGWNIPLIESLAAGTPVIYSNWGAQLEFASGLGTPVRIQAELPAKNGEYYGWGGEVHGLYAEPDKRDLTLKIRECYDNWEEKKEKALEDSKIIIEKFNWENIGKSGYETIKMLNSNPTPNKYWFNTHFVGGPFFEVMGKTEDKFLVQFIDSDLNKIIYEDTIGCNMWTRPSIKYYVNWLIKVKNLTTNKEKEYKLDLTNRKVLISTDSSSLGDNLAWFGPIDEFRKKHNCIVIASTFKNELFVDQYPEIEFVPPGSVVHNLYATYKLGWFYEDGKINESMHPSNFRDKPMQQTATDILGLNYNPIKPKLKTRLGERPVTGPYVCFGIHATAQAKYWNNPTGWQELADYFRSQGKKIVVISREGNGYMGNFYPNDVLEVEGERTLENAMRYLKYCDMFIGVGSGLSWLSWAMDVPTVLISGFSWPSTEILDDNVIRVFKGGACTGCFNRHRLDAGNWNWCPDHENTPRHFECTKRISASDVIKQIEDYLERGIANKSNEVIIQESYELGMVQNHSEILNATEFIKNFKIKNFIEIGTDQGGTFAIWSKISAEDGIRISVDLPHGEFGRNDYNVNLRDLHLKSLGSNVHMIHGDSHSAEIKYRVNKILNNSKVDFLFIDGDHTYEGVKRDYEMYKEFVKDGGWIGFHDIKDTDFHRGSNCRVDLLWNELEGEKIEFIDGSSELGGIGFIQKNKINKIKTMDITKFDWGPTSEEFKELTIKEIFNEQIYLKYFSIEEEDIVVDLGASIGDFIWSIKDKKPKHCWVVEPLDNHFDTLQNNLLGYPISFVKAAISSEKDVKITWDGMICKPRVLSFKEFREENNIKHIDFLKIDCEGGEYSVFTQDNLEYLKNVKKIVIEFHLHGPIGKAKFRVFRDNILPQFKKVIVRSTDDVNIEWDLWNDHFLEYYNEVLIYIDNR